MVLDDPFFENKRTSPALGLTSVARASAVARVSSFSIDLILLFPLLNLVFVPFYKVAQTSALLDDKIRAFQALGSGLGMMALAYVISTALFLSMWRATPGQKVLGLQVASPRTTLGGWILRQSWVVISLLLGGLPFLGVILSKSHQSWGDKITDSFVEASHRHFQAHYRPQVERWGRRAVGAAVVLVLALGTQFLKFSPAPVMGPASTHLGCERAYGADLEKSLSLFAAGLISADCLDQQSNQSLLQQEPRALVYLAKSFSQAEGPLSDSYLKKVCVDPGPELSGQRACQFAQLIVHWSQWIETNPPQVSSALLLGLGADYAVIWGVRQYLSKQWWREAMVLLDHLSDRAYLADFVQPQRVTALLSLGKEDQVVALFESSGGLWKRNLRDEVSQVICGQQLGEGCGAAEAMSCRYFLQGAQDRGKADRAASALILQVLSCPQHRSLARSEVWQKRLHPDLLPLWKAVRTLHDGDRQKAELMIAGQKEAPSLMEDPVRAPSSDPEAAP